MFHLNAHGVKRKILCFLGSLIAVQVTSAPGLFCEFPQYDFGTVIAGGLITNDFVVMNAGDAPVVVSGVRNCCGVTSSITPTKIPPGSNAVCKAVFNTRNRYGKQDKQILIASDDRKHPYYELKIVGTLLKPVEISPRIVRIGTLLQDSETAHIITATNMLEKAVELRSVSSGVNGITADVVGGTAARLSLPKSDPAQEQRSWTIMLKTTPPIATGKLLGTIQLNFSTGTVNVPVLGTVKPVIQVVPKSIKFASRSKHETERLIMLRGEDGRSFKIISANLVNAEGSVEVKKLNESRWQCRLFIITDRLVTGSALKIMTSCKLPSEITIPLLAQ